MRNPHAGQPFTTSDEEIASALLDVSIPTLMLSLVHMAGDATLIRGALKPAGLFLNEVQGYMSEQVLAGIRLKEAGIPFTIVEKNAGPGGTWYQNTYPGARVDVGNHFYCYSFEPTDRWTHFFAEQPELQAYFQRVMDKYGIAPHVRWQTEVTDASWDEATATWTIRTRGLDGAVSALQARAVISAVGQLDRPYLPPIPGRESFCGDQFHSAEWDHSVDLTGKRVAMIGAGAAGSRSHRRSPRTSNTSPSSSGPPSGYFPTRTITRPSDRVCGGRLNISRSTAGGTGFSCSGPVATRVWRPRGSTPAIRISKLPSARSTRSTGSCSPSGSLASSATITSWPRRSCPTTRRRVSARCRTTAAGCGR